MHKLQSYIIRPQFKGIVMHSMHSLKWQRNVMKMPLNHSVL